MARSQTRKVVGVCLFGLVFACIHPCLAGPETEGEWEAVLPWLPSSPVQVGVHGILLKTGKVLYVNNVNKAWLFDPADESTALLPDPPLFSYIYCSGHCQIADGRVILFGGGPINTDPNNRVVVFDPDKAEADINDPTMWTLLTDTLPTDGRWYPTAAPRGDGTILVLGGGRNNELGNRNIPLVFDINKPLGERITSLSNAERHFPNYPFVFQVSDGTLFMAGSDEYPDPETNCPGDPPCGGECPALTQTLDVALEQWSDVHESEIPGGSAVLFRPNKVLKAGGHYPCGVSTFTDRAMMINLSAETPEWTNIDSLTYPRLDFYLVTLADGQVLAVGGDDVRNVAGGSVFIPEMLDATKLGQQSAPKWRDMAQMPTQRIYHSSVVLLPDARVLTAGGAGENLSMPETNATIFRPPYLFDSNGDYIPDPDRPQIVNPPSEMYYNNVLILESPDAQNITKVSLIRLGAATHSYDHNTRFVPLNFVWRPSEPDKLKISVPKSEYVAPRGYYMLFILESGVPSKAAIMKLTHLILP